MVDILFVTRMLVYLNQAIGKSRRVGREEEGRRQKWTVVRGEEGTLHSEIYLFRKSKKKLGESVKLIALRGEEGTLHPEN